MHIQQEQDRLCSTPAKYVADFPTQLALARWTQGGDIPHVFLSTQFLPKRADWYAEAQRQFQAWLEDGGFHRPETIADK